MTDFDLPWDDSEARFFRECDQRIMDADSPEVGIVEQQLTASGKRTWLETNKVPLHDDTGKVIGILGTYHDITKQKLAETALKQTNEDLEKRVSERTRKLRFLAEHDNLTGLLNRSSFVVRLNEALRSGEPFALLFVDLDRFKPINDNEGHEVGDQVLVEVAKVLRRETRSSDVVGRFGGDEFVAVAHGIEDEAGAGTVCSRIHQRLAEIRLDDRPLPVSASIGVSLSKTSTGPTADQMLRDADIAMYAAKANEQQKHCVYNGDVLERAKRTREMEHEIQWSVAKNELTLRYQPIIDLGDNRISSLEALLRWNHPVQGFVPPLEFIPVAERTGMISAMGEFVLREACQQLKTWWNAMPEYANKLTVNVNVSAVQITDPNFVSSVKSVVAASGLPPEAVKFEVTETVLVRDSDKTILALEQLQASGFSIVLDDFGTGYSSLSYLDQLPIDTVKIDRSFVQKLGKPESSKAIVLMILALAETLNMSVVAEGVETEQQAQALQRMRCDQVQGTFSENR